MPEVLLQRPELTFESLEGPLETPQLSALGGPAVAARLESLQRSTRLFDLLPRLPNLGSQPRDLGSDFLARGLVQALSPNGFRNRQGERRDADCQDGRRGGKRSSVSHKVPWPESDPTRATLSGARAHQGSRISSWRPPSRSELKSSLKVRCGCARCCGRRPIRITRPLPTLTSTTAAARSRCSAPSM